METNPKTIKAGLALRREPSVWSSAFTRSGPPEGGTPNSNAPALLSRLSVRRFYGLKFANCCKSMPRWVRQSKSK